MAIGFYLVQGDKTTCGGRIIEGATDHTIFGKAAAREKDRVLCGKHPGTFLIAGGIVNDTIHGRRMAGTLDSESTCPCKAKFIPSMLQDTYEKASGGSAAGSESSASNPVARPLPAYLTGEKAPSGFVPDYPVLSNTHDLPDMALRSMLKNNNQDVMLLTLEEAFEVLASWGSWKSGWNYITQSVPGQILVNYGTNIRDAITTALIISKLGSFSIKATYYVNHKGTELIKISGYPSVRKILTAPVFSIKNPKIVDLGIGKYGMAMSIVEGARLTFYVAAAYRTLDFILNDETSLAQFLGRFSTDIIKIGIASGLSWAVGAGAVAYLPLLAAPLVVVVGCGFLAVWGLNTLDDKFKVTDALVNYIEHAQQEVAQKALELDRGIWDLGNMYADQMLDKGREVLEYQIRKYIRESIKDISLRFK
ncbi:PAAR domain-containing protein [Pantoea agglomerans]